VPARVTFDRDHKRNYEANGGAALRIRVHENQDISAVFRFDVKRE
jgi:hypothetical protein